MIKFTDEIIWEGMFCLKLSGEILKLNFYLFNFKVRENIIQYYNCSQNESCFKGVSLDCVYIF